MPTPLGVWRSWRGLLLLGMLGFGSWSSRLLTGISRLPKLRRYDLIQCSFVSMSLLVFDILIVSFLRVCKARRCSPLGLRLS